MLKEIQWTDSTVYPKMDRIMYDRNSRSGILKGCGITHLGTNQLRIAAGYMVIKGGLIEVTQTDVNVELSSSGSKSGQLWVRLDLSQSTPITLMSEAVSTLTELTKNEDCNYDNGIYEMQLCTYTINETTISNLTETAQMLKNHDYVDVTGTLAAGSTTITLTDATITTSSTIDVYTSVYGANPSAMTVATGSLTLTFDAQTSAIGVKVRVS